MKRGFAIILGRWRWEGGGGAERHARWRSRPAPRCPPLRAQPSWQDTRAGVTIGPQTSAGEVNLKIPKLTEQTFEPASIKRHRQCNTANYGFALSAQPGEWQRRRGKDEFGPFNLILCANAYTSPLKHISPVHGICVWILYEG